MPAQDPGPSGDEVTTVDTTHRAHESKGRGRSAWRSTVRFVRRLPVLLLVGILRAYQSVISPMTGPTCKYYPSCSQYALVAVKRHGALRGSRLAVWRILRCNPWSDGGVDDVPASRTDHDHSHHDR